MFDGALPEFESQFVRDLRAARTLILRGWCQGTMAKAPDGMSCPVDYKDANKFCMVGAIQRVAGVDTTKSKQLVTEIGNVIRGPVVGFNDSDATRWTHVLSVFDTAIKRLKDRDAVTWKRKLARKVKRVEEMAHV